MRIVNDHVGLLAAMKAGGLQFPVCITLQNTAAIPRCEPVTGVFLDGGSQEAPTMAPVVVKDLMTAVAMFSNLHQYAALTGLPYGTGIHAVVEDVEGEEAENKATQQAAEAASAPQAQVSEGDGEAGGDGGEEPKDPPSELPGKEPAPVDSEPNTAAPAGPGKQPAAVARRGPRSDGKGRALE